MIGLSDIVKPTLILDEARCRNNIRMMAGKAKSSGVRFRPHFKTHQSITVGTWFMEEGVESITVSSVTMARHFSGGGWKDITIAFPLNIREMRSLKELSGKSELNILAANPGHLDHILASADFHAGCFIKVNTGNNRSGTDYDDGESLTRMAEWLAPSDFIRLKGLLTHAGHTYKAESPEEIMRINDESISRLQHARSYLDQPGLIISTGDTPSCSIAGSFTGADEIRPGNFVFYDLMQLQLGSCSSGQIAVAVACPVVQKNERKKELIIYGGGVHLSKDSLRLKDGRTVFGQAVYLNEYGWQFPQEEIYLRSISQEHGILAAGGDFFKETGTGDLVGIIPVHSCMTADLLREYRTTDGRIISDFSPK